MFGMHTRSPQALWLHVSNAPDAGVDRPKQELEREKWKAWGIDQVYLAFRGLCARKSTGGPKD